MVTKYPHKTNYVMHIDSLRTPAKADTIDMVKDILQGDVDLTEDKRFATFDLETMKEALALLRKVDVNGDYADDIENNGWRLMYYRKPPTPEEFLTYEWIGPQAETLWPNLRKCFIEFMDPSPLCSYRNLALSVSIGWGKSLMTVLVLTYIAVLFGMMRKPYKLLNHSQPVYENVLLPDGTYTTVGDLKVGMKIAGVTQKESEVLDIIEQGNKETIELELSNNMTVRCSEDHLWTVWNVKKDVYEIHSTKTIIHNPTLYLFPEESDCNRDRELLIQAEEKIKNITEEELALL